MRNVVNMLVVFTVLVLVIGLAEIGSLAPTGMTTNDNAEDSTADNADYSPVYVVCDFSRCQYGCNEFGACLDYGEKQENVFSIPKYVPAEGCMDSDSGVDYNVKGTITGIASCPNGCSDECIDELGFSYNIWERYCENNRMMGAGYNCPGGCVSGRCI